MGTDSAKDMLSAALFGKTRRAVLALLFNRPDESFYLREIVRSAGVGQGTVQRELEQLTRTGVVQRFRRGRQVYFQANSECPVFAELCGIIRKTAGIVDVLRDALGSLQDRISVAFVYGSYASGQQRQGSDVDICVVGEVSFTEVIAAIAPAQKKLGREINPTVYPAAEFRQKLADGHHFVSSVADGLKLYVVGDEREFARLGK